MTHTVLHIDASARYEGSVSRELSQKITDSLAPSKVIRRDLAEGVSFLNETWVGATFTAPDERSDAQNDSLTLSDTLVQEVIEADTIVIGTPMYNFNVPAVVKAWIDQIARAGVTFAYTENGPKGLLENKKVVIAMASGGVPVGSDMDHASSYLKFVFGFVGITDVTILNAEQAEELATAA